MFINFKNFYISNMKLIHKFWLNQFAISLLGFSVITALDIVSGDNCTSIIIASICAGLFFCALLYDSAWEEGLRDHNKITNYRLNMRPLHGMKVALFAYIPTFIIVLPAIILNILGLLGVESIKGVLGILSVIALYVCNGMYLGFSLVLVDALQSICPQGFGYQFIFLAYIIPATISYLLGYYMGCKDKQLKTFFGMKPTKGAPYKPKKQ